MTQGTSVFPPENKPQSLGGTSSFGRDSVTLARLSPTLRHSRQVTSTIKRTNTSVPRQPTRGRTNFGNYSILLDGCPSAVKIAFVFGSQVLFSPHPFRRSRNSPSWKSLPFHHRVEKFWAALPQSWDLPARPEIPAPEQVTLGHAPRDGMSFQEGQAHSSALVPHPNRDERGDALGTDFAVVL